MERILIVNVNWLGDALLSTVVIRALRENSPDSYISCMITPRVKEIFQDNPHLDEIIIYDEENKHRSLLGKIRFICELKRKDFDKVFLLHRSFTRTLLCYLAGIPERVGYYTKKRGFLLTRKIPPVRRDSLHRLDFYLKIIEETGIQIKNRDYVFRISDIDREYVNSLLKEEEIENDFLVAINPGANWKPKRWPTEYFAQISDNLIRNFQAKVIITGSKDDSDLVLEISSLMKEKAVNLCGKINLKQLGALFEKVSLVVTGDTGPMHIASAIGVKLLCLFGPTSPFITGPIGKGFFKILQKNIKCKIPCYKTDCRDNICMKMISPDEVLKNIIEILQLS